MSGRTPTPEWVNSAAEGLRQVSPDDILLSYLPEGEVDLRRLAVWLEEGNSFKQGTTDPTALLRAYERALKSKTTEVQQCRREIEEKWRQETQEEQLSSAAGGTDDESE